MIPTKEVALVKPSCEQSDSTTHRESVTKSGIVKRLSDALLKVRPPGGSELFIRYGDDYVADPDFCGSEIERIRQENIELKLENVRLRRTSGEAS